MSSDGALRHRGCRLLAAPGSGPSSGSFQRGGLHARPALTIAGAVPAIGGIASVVHRFFRCDLHPADRAKPGMKSAAPNPLLGPRSRPATSQMTSTQPRDAAIEQAVAAPPEDLHHPPPLDQPRIAALDGIRGFAILLIIHSHCSDLVALFVPGTLPAYLLRLTPLTWTRIDFLLVLSGFLIGGILPEARPSPTYYRTFYIRRADRIQPKFGAVSQ